MNCRRRRFQIAWLAAIVLVCGLGVERPDGLGDVVEIRHWSYPDYTRVVIETDRHVDVSLHELPPDPEHERPQRVYLELPEIWVGLDYPEPIPVKDGLLRAVRVGQNTLTKTRVVIDIESYERYRLLQLTAPDRVVIDFFRARPGVERPAPGATGDVRLPLPMRPIRKVVLDPGHGGKDPGAIGIGKLQEKDVTLALAKALRKELEAQGFEVALTREEDRYLSLEERTAKAEGLGGDLFVSVHVNASKRKTLSGIETYYLDEKAEWQSIRVAARENGIDPRAMNALQRTIAQLRIAEVSEHSKRLAENVHRSMLSGLQKKYRDLVDLGVKQGPFYVLFLSSMPSILLECGFVTNHDDAKLLRDEDFLQDAAVQIASGLSAYREKVSVVAVGAQP